MEYPIIFMGYSISDSNVQSIIKAIVNCLDASQIKLLEDRFIFIEFNQEMVGAQVTPYTIMIDDKPLTMKKIMLSDFMLLYNAMENKKSKLPVAILRKFKQELYEYTITNLPTANLRLIAHLEENQIEIEELEDVLKEIFKIDVNVLQSVSSNERSDIRRLIRIYDYLKWGK